MDDCKAGQKNRQEEDIDGKLENVDGDSSGAEELDRSKNKLVREKHSVQMLVEHFQLFILM